MIFENMDQLLIDNIVVMLVEFKFLSSTISKDLSWVNDIASMVEKANIIYYFLLIKLFYYI